MTEARNIAAFIGDYARRIRMANGQGGLSGAIDMQPQFQDALWARGGQIHPLLGKVNVPLISTDTAPLLYENRFDFIAKRTQVSPQTRRVPSDPKLNRTVTVAEVEFDYSEADQRVEAMASRDMQSFMALRRDYVAGRTAADVLTIGFGGTSQSAATTTGVSDIAVGWIQGLRAAKPTNIMSEVVAGSGVITIGPKRVLAIEGAAVDAGGGLVGFPVTAHGRPAGAQVVIAGTTNYDGTYLVDASSTEDQLNVTAAYVAEDTTGKTITHTPDYPSLDAIAVDLRLAIPAVMRTELVVMIGADLLGGEEQRLVDSGTGSPGEKSVIAQGMVIFGGMSLEPTPFIPDGVLIVTALRNLSIYRKDFWRRTIMHSEEYRAMIDWNRFRIGFAVENLDMMMAAENMVVTR